MFKRKLRGEKLIRSLPYGEYEINNQRVRIFPDRDGDMEIEAVPFDPASFAWFSSRTGTLLGEWRFERFIGMKAKHITERHIKQVYPEAK